MSLAHGREVVGDGEVWQWQIKTSKASHHCDDPRCCGRDTVHVTMQRKHDGALLRFSVVASTAVTPKKVAEFIREEKVG